MKGIFAAVVIVGLSVSLPSAAQGMSAAVFLGTPMSGVTLSQYNGRISLGIEEKGIAFDGLWNLGDWTARPDLSHIYGYTGAIWVDNDKDKWGPRAGFGIHMPMGYGNVELYGEAGTIWYWQNDAKLKLEGAVGLRFYF